jgi:DNA repair protein RadA/Sms
MAKTSLICKTCGYRALQWRGRCPDCGEWDSFSQAQAVSATTPLVPLAEIDPEASRRMPTGISELDRVLGGGLVAGSVVLLAGEPGIGKSTLALQVAAGLQRERRRVAVVCGEESMSQVAARARRISDSGGVSATEETDIDLVGAHLGSVDVAIVDSIQTIRGGDAPGEPGSVSQVRHCAATLGRAARSSNAAVILIGHVTKDGAVAGPKTLEHLVDVVLNFEGDRGQVLRTIRSAKNRFGPSPEVAVFEMRPEGLREIADASGLFINDRRPDSHGSALACILEGRRALALEVQALVVKAQTSVARRLGNGIDSTRISLAAAVLQKRARVSLGESDVYARIAGGFRTDDPGLDLPLALAMASSRREKAIPHDLIAIGEVGLGGEVRGVSGVNIRLAEAARLGLRRALVPPGTEQIEGIAIQAVEDIAVALNYLE